MQNITLFFLSSFKIIYAQDGIGAIKKVLYSSMDIRAKKSNVQENNGSVLFLPLNRIFLLSFLFFSGVFYTQKWSPEKIDRLQDKIGSQYMQEGRIYEGIEQTKSNTVIR
jgi:hypothetical protein